MSKRDDYSTEELNDELSLLEEEGIEPSIENGPTPALVPTFGKIESVMQKYTHCPI